MNEEKNFPEQELEEDGLIVLLDENDNELNFQMILPFENNGKAYVAMEPVGEVPGFEPDEVLIMAEKYKTPSLCNYFCARQCPIGQQYVPEIRNSELSDIVLKMLASLNAMDRKKERLIEIAADGTISKDEIDDFVRIQKELERISVTVETLQLWVEKMLANGRIDTEAYNKESEVP